MNRDFEIVDGIYLKQSSYELDMHNNFDFSRFTYSIENRTISLEFKRASGDWVANNVPSAVIIVFNDVEEFRFLPRNTSVPLTEDNCISSIGYWVDEDWAKGVVVTFKGQIPEDHWLTAIEFVSGAVLIVKAVTASAAIMA